MSEGANYVSVTRTASDRGMELIHQFEFEHELDPNEETVCGEEDELSGIEGGKASADGEQKVEDKRDADIVAPLTNFERWTLPFLYYSHKFLGVKGKTSPPMANPLEMMWSSCLAFVGIFLVTVTDYYYLQRNFETNDMGVKMLTGAYAATSVLVYEAYQSPLAQPRNVLGSYAFCSVTGVTVRIVCDEIGLPRYITGSVAIFFSILVMNITKTVHPPGGACGLLAVIGGKLIEELGYGYVLTSIGAAIVMVAWACIGNNLIPTRQYPLYWW